MTSAARSLDPTLLRAQRGEPAARRALVERHGPRIWSLCRRLTPGEAEDCYQRIWEKVLRALPGFDPTGAASLDTWIGTIARRSLIDRHRRRGRRGELVELGDRESGAASAELLLERQQRALALERALAMLPAEQRRAVLLHHLQGVSLERLAEEEGVALGTVKSRLHRGRARLAALLGGEA